MKKLKLFSAVIATIFIFSGVTPVRAAFLGDLCWLLPNIDPDEVTRTKLGITNVGGGHFSLNGIAIDEFGVPETDVTVIQGSGEIVGSDLVLILNFAFSDIEVMGAGSLYAKLSLDTLSGTHETIDTFFDKTDEVISSNYESGDMVSIPCP